MQSKDGATTNVDIKYFADRHKVSQNEDIGPCLNLMTRFLALMEQQCIDEPLMWLKGHGKSVFHRLKKQ